MSLNTAKIDAIQGFYLDHKDEIYTETFVQPSYSNMMMVDTKDRMLLPDAEENGSVLQSWQGGHQQKGETVMGGRELKMKKVKVDRRFLPGQFSVDHYNAFLYRTGNDPRDFPYERFVIQSIMNRMYHDVAMDVMWNGIEKGVIDGAPNNPTDVADGFKKHLRDMIAAGNLAPYLTGAITSANAVDKVRDFVKTNLNTTALRSQRFACYCSLDTLDNYQEGYETAYGANVRSDDPYALTRIHGTNAFLVPQDGLTGSELALSKPNNFHIGLDGAPYINLTLLHRYLYVEIDWKYATQINSHIDLFVNGQV